MKKYFIYSFLICLCFTNCKTGFQKQRGIKTVPNSDKPLSEVYNPIYKMNGGEKNTNIFNKNKAIREKEFMALLKTLGGKKNC